MPFVPKPRKAGDRKDITVKKFGVATDGLGAYVAGIPSIQLSAQQKSAAAARAKARKTWLQTTSDGQNYQLALTAAKRAKHKVLSEAGMFTTKQVSVLKDKPKRAKKPKKTVVKMVPRT